MTGRRPPHSDPLETHRDALRLLRRRPLFEEEIRRGLRKSGHAEEAVETALDRLRAAGHVDDLKLAMHVMLARATRLGHGPKRLRQELRRRCVPETVARRAWERLLDDGDLDPDDLLDRELRKRLAIGGRVARRSRHARVYNAMVRAGFDPEAVESALGRHGVCLDDSEESVDQEPNDDIG